jgi:hypothetical protein
MIDLPAISPSTLIPAMLGVYALSFIAGGIYYLEQRVARIRDQFPDQVRLAQLTGYAALGIGLLAALGTGGHMLHLGPEFRTAALVASTSGVAFWIYHIHVDRTPPSRIRDGLLALICGTLAILTGWWITTL